jgi:hypothetical protein
VEVPSEHDGRLLFVGIPWSPAQKAEDKELQRRIAQGKVVQISLGYLVIEEPHPDKVAKDQQITFPDQRGKVYRRIRQGETLVPGHVRVALIPHWLRKMELGDKVQEGDLLGVVDPNLALEDLEIKVAKFTSAEADRRASEKTRDEAKKRYDAMIKLQRLNPRSVSDEEVSGGELTWQRYIEEEIAKAAMVRVAERELLRSLAILRMHEIHSPENGAIRVIYKKRGEGVKNLEPVCQIEIAQDDK